MSPADNVPSLADLGIDPDWFKANVIIGAKQLRLTADGPVQPDDHSECEPTFWPGELARHDGDGDAYDYHRHRPGRDVGEDDVSADEPSFHDLIWPDCDNPAAHTHGGGIEYDAIPAAPVQHDDHGKCRPSLAMPGWWLYDDKQWSYHRHDAATTIGGAK